jgi:hypothetical protein
MLLFTVVADFEDTTRLALLTRRMSPRLLTNSQIRNAVSTFNVAWDE